MTQRYVSIGEGGGAPVCQTLQRPLITFAEFIGTVYIVRIQLFSKSFKSGSKIK